MNHETRAPEHAAPQWVPQRWSARFIRIAVVAAPFMISLAASWWLRSLMAAPSTWTESILTLAVLASVGISVAIAVERVVRRALPLASLLELSLVFPDRAPSRFGVALRAGSKRELKRQVEHVRANNLSSNDAEAAEQVLELVEALRNHEPLTRGHTDRVRAYSELIAEEMGLSVPDRSRLQWAVLLHDIGKLAVPATLLNKDGAPTAEEWVVIRTHPAVGAEMVEPLADWLGEWRHSAGQHHERWDGSGYPTGLAGEEISLAGRIVAVADAYDVITSARSYKAPISADLAREELVRSSGTHFDPTVVRAMLRVSVGNVSSVAGRLSWLTLLPSVLRPAAAATAGTVAATTAVLTGATATLPLTATEPPAVVGYITDAPAPAERETPDPTAAPQVTILPSTTSTTEVLVVDESPSTSTSAAPATTTTLATDTSTTSQAVGVTSSTATTRPPIASWPKPGKVTWPAPTSRTATWPVSLCSTSTSVALTCLGLTWPTPLCRTFLSPTPI